MVGTQSPKLKLMDHFHCKLLCNTVALWVVLLRNEVPVICKLVWIAATPTKGKESQINPRLNFSFRNSEDPSPNWIASTASCSARLHLGFFAAHPYSASRYEFAVTPTKKSRNLNRIPRLNLSFRNFQGLRRVETQNPKPGTHSDLKNPKTGAPIPLLVVVQDCT